MRWGTGELRWVRPIQSIIALFDGGVVPFEIEGIKSGNTTVGHRFIGTGQPFTVSDFADYTAKLRANGVVLDAAERKTIITDQIAKLCADKGVELVEDAGLLDEVAGLAEWPVAILGNMDPAFLDLPAEVIKTSMRNHQRYFAVRDPKTGGLAPHFITIANIAAHDGGTAIAAGNARVLSARLNDARYYYYQDQRVPLASYAEKFAAITFYGTATLADRVAWMTDLAPAIANMIGADAGKAKQAASMAKCDLVTGMVGEFPELQGIMGRYYATFQGYDPEVCAAIGDQYKPAGSASAEMAKVSAAVALAEKLTHLAFFFANDLKPTGSKDPYALRRAAIGSLRIVLDNGIRVSLSAMLNIMGQPKVAAELVTFFLDRLKVLLRDQGFAHDQIDAVLSLGDDDIVRVVARLRAVQASLTTPAGADVLAGYTRAANLTKDEKEPRTVDTARLSHDLERTLHDTVTRVDAAVKTALGTEDFSGALAHLATLRAPIDALCDGLRVNDDDAAVAANRLALLASARAVHTQVADFSKIEG